jgi:phosphoglycerol transferase MdoB-like AlkP superfamily enzyme
MIFLFVSIVLLAQASITVYTYRKDKKASDLNYMWSWLVIVFSIVAVGASGWAVFHNRGSAQQAVANMRAPTQNVASLEAQLNAAKAVKAAQLATAAAAAGAA